MKFLKLAALLPLLLFAGCKAPYPPGTWLTKVSPQAHAQADPLPPTAANVAAGRDTYRLYCVGCHSTDGLGRRGRPSLRTARVRAETDGDIHWILENGSKGHGMPAWRSLGEPALWQLVQYIRSMPQAPPR